MTYTTVNINTPPPYLTLTRNEKLPVVLTVAGSDSSGGAGIEADIKTISAHRCYAMTCITALTSQTPAKVYNIHRVPREVVRTSLQCNMADMRCDAIKTGMLTVEAIEELSNELKKDHYNDMKLIVDPVLVATSGSILGGEKLKNELINILTPLATLVTPNIPECFQLIGHEVEIKSERDVISLARQVAQATKCPNILVKGGHIPWSNNGITDILYLGQKSRVIIYRGRFSNTTNTHGTGCTLAAAISSNMARGYSLEQSVYGGIEYVQNAVSIGCDVTKPHVSSNGPINHIYAVEIPFEKMVEDECFRGHDILESSKLQAYDKKINNFFDYLVHHPLVKPHWAEYIGHDFVRQVVEGTLAVEKFKFFIEQDYSYLIDYARVHCIAASKSPTLDDLENELKIVGSVRHEMEEHEIRLREVFCVKDDKYFQSINRGGALNNYSRYLNDIARRGDWQELTISLSPCLMGYGHAVEHFKSHLKIPKGHVFRNWYDTYTSKKYRDAMKKGEQLLDHIAANYPKERIETLVQIFADVCELEIKFWDAAVEFSS